MIRQQFHQRQQIQKQIYNNYLDDQHQAYKIAKDIYNNKIEKHKDFMKHGTKVVEQINKLAQRD